METVINELKQIDFLKTVKDSILRFSKYQEPILKNNTDLENNLHTN